MDWLLAFLLVVCVLAGWVGTLFSLPGNWLIVASAALYAWLGPESESRLAIGGWVVAGLLVLALLGELIEFAAGAVGAQQAGASKRAAVLSLVGSLIGGIAGAFLGLPIPVVGSILAAILGAALGAGAGAIGGELWLGRELDDTWQVGLAAFLGRLCGTIGKILVGSVLCAVTLVAMAVR